MIGQFLWRVHLTKRMSKTMAAEIADRTMEVVNPQNRPLTLDATLRRHGFAEQPAPSAEQLADRGALKAWLLATYAPRD